MLPIAIAALVVAPKTFLVFSKTTGYRHESIPAGIAAIAEIAKKRKWKVEASEDSAVFEPSNLKRFAAIVFVSTTGDILNPDQKTAMQAFVENGGGFVGIHAASDTEYKWEWYGKLVGAWFNGHPAIQEGKIKIEDKKHPSTSFLPDPWVHTDEWYNFKTNPRADVTVLASADETSYKGGTMNGDHPIIWCHSVGKGRSWYTALGHTNECYKDPLFLRTVEEGMNWVIGRKR
jgi:cytochrome c